MAVVGEQHFRQHLWLILLVRVAYPPLAEETVADS